MRLNRVKLFLLLLSIFLVLFYEKLPKKHANLYPDLTKSVGYAADTNSGGNSKFKWINESEMHWLCDMLRGIEHPYCGMSLRWSEDNSTTIDLSEYTHLRLHVRYTGNKKHLRFFLRNFYPVEGESDPVEGSKFNLFFIPTKALEQPYDIPLDKLKVADWWAVQHNVPPEDSFPDVKQMLAAGIDLGPPHIYEKHEFQLYSLAAVGVYFTKESLYLSLLIFWALLLIPEMLINQYKVRKKLVMRSKMLNKVTKESAQYKENAETDLLTKVLNRHGLNQLLSNLQTSNVFHEYALLVIDLDKFKYINDLYGHLEGDRVLREIASSMRQSIRAYDHIARWGGDEFILLLKCNDIFNLRRVAENIRVRIEKGIQVNDEYDKVTVSIGGTLIQQGEDFESAFLRADEELLQSKSRGRNQVSTSDGSKTHKSSSLG